VKQKIALVQKAYSKPLYVAKFARESGLARDTDIRKWKKMLGKLKEKVQINPHAKSVHKGPVVKELEYLNGVKEWII
jgi:uncharacterized protein (DUF305 family)